MKNCRTIRIKVSCRPRRRWVPEPILALLVVLFVLLPASPDIYGQDEQPAPPESASDLPSSGPMSLEQFRSLVASRLATSVGGSRRSREPLPAPDLRPAEEVFLHLLLLQAEEAAVHRSLERLSEWTKDIQARVQIQTAPQLDVDVARFAEARMTVASARLEAEQARVIAKANKLLGRPATAPLLILQPEPAAVDQQAEQVLTQGEEMVGRMYESYRFGGLAITSLMEYENELYEFELEYRQTLGRNTMRAATE